MIVCATLLWPLGKKEPSTLSDARLKSMVLEKSRIAKKKLHLLFFDVN